MTDFGQRRLLVKLTRLQNVDAMVVKMHNDRIEFISADYSVPIKLSNFRSLNGVVLEHIRDLLIKQLRDHKAKEILNSKKELNRFISRHVKIKNWRTGKEFEKQLPPVMPASTYNDYIHPDREIGRWGGIDFNGNRRRPVIMKAAKAILQEKYKSYGSQIIERYLRRIKYTKLHADKSFFDLMKNLEIRMRERGWWCGRNTRDVPNFGHGMWIDGIYGYNCEDERKQRFDEIVATADRHIKAMAAARKRQDELEKRKNEYYRMEDEFKKKKLIDSRMKRAKQIAAYELMAELKGEKA